MSSRGEIQQKEAIFKAIADPTRRAILDRLRTADRSVNELCESFKITQPAVSQHLKVLKAVGLVTVAPVGRERIYRLNAVLLQAVYDWVSHYEEFWTDRLDALGKYLDKEKENNEY